MASDNSYDPSQDTIDILMTGLLPAFIIGLFEGFEYEKKTALSFINIFDDFIIIGSILIYPLITASQWSQLRDISVVFEAIGTIF
ncbi:hypothetical protein F8M41_009631 [Gigaspora margarita]|uniref:Uncharacterized protein n=1 Tax=Gigaspora margarita TaxID=4874 RepID=A0A8H4A1U3_GIGMA|nr:hypothetical protein F8M41_009631 [Gigaspora margarita]